jgi:hypothetical protein
MIRLVEQLSVANSEPVGLETREPSLRLAFDDVEIQFLHTWNNSASLFKYFLHECPCGFLDAGVTWVGC